MAAAVMQAISLGAFHLEAVSITPKVPAGTVTAWLSVWPKDRVLQFSPTLVVVAMLRLMWATDCRQSGAAAITRTKQGKPEECWLRFL